MPSIRVSDQALPPDGLAPPGCDRSPSVLRKGLIAARLAGAALACQMLLAGCGTYPKDAEGTLETIERRHTIRAAIATVDERQQALARRFLDSVAQSTGAVLQLRPTRSSEALFASLETGKTDIVVAEVAADSPWLADVAVIEPLSRRREGERDLQLSPITRNGENRWIMLLERQVRDLERGS